MFRRCAPSLAINRVTVFGSGTMGGGIAQVSATAGLSCNVVDVSDEVLGRNKDVIAKSLGRIVKKKLEKSGGDVSKVADNVAEIMARINFTTDAQAAVKETDLVVEAILENIDAKKKLWQSIDGAAAASTIFATNTSSLSVDDQASCISSRAERFAGLHFFSPVPMMKLVEVVTGAKTSQAVVDDLFDYSKRIGKVPIACKDTKGFVVNRLLVPYMNEAFKLVERGVASVEDVDTAMCLGAGMPMGPCRLADNIGLDVIENIIQGWHATDTANPIFSPCKTVTDKVKAGKLGVKSGEGFYVYNKK